VLDGDRGGHEVDVRPVDGERFADADPGVEHEPAQVREVLLAGGVVSVELSEPVAALGRGLRTGGLPATGRDARDVAHRVGADRAVADRSSPGPPSRLRSQA
jgi:hypothetical protein